MRHAVAQGVSARAAVEAARPVWRGRCGCVASGTHSIGQRPLRPFGDRFVEQHHDFVAAGRLPRRRGRGLLLHFLLGRPPQEFVDLRPQRIGRRSFDRGRRLSGRLRRHLWLRPFRLGHHLSLLRVVDLVNHPDHEKRRRDENADDLVQASGE